ncbi:MAG: glutamine amidotransferase [Bacillota bacterium]|nr:glutamine amidotransferase [Bacillota bacterium]
MKLVIGHLYPELMGIYGDRGNVLALARRAAWHGHEVEVRHLARGERPHLASVDVLVLGGGQDKEQVVVCEDLQGPLGGELRAAIEDGLVVLSICGGYQLLGHYYQPHRGDKLPGLSVFDAYTVAGPERFIGNVVISSPLLPEGAQTVVGFENHSGLTYLGPGVQPLGTVLKGKGNNGRDATEGAVYKNCFGTYLHGPVLPKNPRLVDHLLARALERRYGSAPLNPLDDRLEVAAHQAAVRLPR